MIHDDVFHRLDFVVILFTLIFTQNLVFLFITFTTTFLVRNLLKFVLDYFGETVSKVMLNDEVLFVLHQNLICCCHSRISNEFGEHDL